MAESIHFFLYLCIVEMILSIVTFYERIDFLTRFS